MIKDNKKQIRSWVMYDWANSAFATTIGAAILPIFYQDVAARDLPDYLATAYWGYTRSVAMILIVILAPFLGSIADHSRSKRQHLMTFALLGITATASLVMISAGDYLLASVIMILATIGFSGSNIFYDAFLPEITTTNERNYVSAKGFAYGYLGGGILLAINLLMVQYPQWFGMPNTLWGIRLSFITVSVWWLLFSIPIFKNLKDTPRDGSNLSTSYLQSAKAGIADLKNTFKTILEHRELIKFLIAFWLYNDAIGTIIGMATVFGREIGIDQLSLMGALLLVQIAGFPFTLIFGKFANRLGTKNSIYITLVVYFIASVSGYFMTSALHFFILAFLVSTSQGASQAFSRSLFSTLIPEKDPAKFFAFYSIFNKMQFVAPAVFAFIGQVTGNSRNGVLTLLFFLVAGALILKTVREKQHKVPETATITA
jgi:UMF1 family MFS transporter